MKKSRLFLLIATTCFVAAMAFSCKKVVDKLPDEQGNVALDTANSTWQDRMYDSVFLYAKEIYYWYDQLPSYEKFLPRQYKTADTLTGLENALFQITRYPKNAAGRLYEQAISYDRYGKPVNDNTHAKYSFLMRTTDSKNGGVEAYIQFDDITHTLKMTLDGKENELGLRVGLIPAKYTYGTADSIDIKKIDSNAIVPFVRYVTKGSPAYNAGIRRGDYITKVNNTTTTDMSEAVYENALRAGNITLTTYKPSTKTEKTVSIQKTLYTYDPFFKDTVITTTSTNNNVTKKIGYAAYKNFSNYDSSSKEPMKRVIDRFTSAGVQDIVIDLRYNGGGYVESASNFCEFLAPRSADGKVMFVNYYNKLMQNKQATILKHQPQRDENDKPKPNKTYFDYPFSSSDNTETFAKQGSLSLPRVYFIVSSETASASELVINSLKPYMSVMLIGAVFSDDATKTYGKPVGFFEVRLGPENKSYSMWIANFETKNANGDGNYYDGFSTDAQAFDDLRFDFGNPQERSFREAIRYILGDMKYMPPVTASRYGGATKGGANEASNMSGARGLSVGNVTAIHDMVVKPGKKK